MKKWKIVYSALFLGISLIPLAGMAVVKEDVSTENRTLKEFPSIRTEEGWNTAWFSEAGAYFQDHFAFRSELVTANALLSGRVFGVSTADGVIQGTNGWLYYKDSLGDYLGTELLSDRALFGIAHCMKLMQDNLSGRGVDFVFTVAPNKNTLYGEQMPYYDSLRVTEDNNLMRLVPILEAEGVRYVDLKGTLKEQEEILYHMRDSHWNNKGAALAADTLMGALGKTHVSHEDAAYEVRTDFIGDLDKMLYPRALTPEDEVYYTTPTTFAYVGEVGSNFDPRINTVNPAKEGSLIVYRDSFGNALLPFLADSYAKAYFSRGVPYQLSDVIAQEADTVIVERAERFLPDMAENPPVMAGRIVAGESVIEEIAQDGAENLVIRPQGAFSQITGKLREAYLEWDSEIYLRINDSLIFEASPRSEGGEDCFFTLYIASASLSGTEDKIEVLIGKDGNFKKIYETLAKEETVQ